jgi:hypothetical protein
MALNIHLPTSAQVKNEYSYISAPRSGLSWLVIGELYLYRYTDMAEDSDK